MNRTLLMMLGSIATLIVVLQLLSQSNQPSASRGKPLMLFCAASNRAVIESLRVDYEKEFGRRVDVQYGPSQTLLASLEVTRAGDLYLPADDSYLVTAREKNLVEEVFPLARMRAGVAVKKGNPKAIRSLADLKREDVRFVQASPDAAAIGNITRQVLLKSQQWNELDRATDAYRTSVTDVANDVLVGAADAGIVYDAVLHTYTGLEFVSVDELVEAVSMVAVGVTTHSRQADAALDFARYLAEPQRGGVRYKEFGFEAIK